MRRLTSRRSPYDGCMKPGSKPKEANRMKTTTTPEQTVGLDVGDKHSHFCEIDSEGTVADDGRVRTTKAALDRTFGSRDRMLIVLETGTHSRWIAEHLELLGHEVLVANARELRLIYASNFKDDRLDAERLARLGRFDRRLLKPVHVRRAQAGRVLTLVRSRRALVESKAKLVNMVRGQVKAFGSRIPSNLTPSKFASWVAANVPELDDILAPTFQALACLLEQIRLLDKQMPLALKKFAPDAEHLTEIQGVGALTVLTFVALIDDPKRFKKARDVGSYFGCVRRRRDSGSQTSELGITKAGDAYMRSLLCNCAHYILGPFGGESDLRTWGLALAARSRKQVAVIAVARKLSVLMLRMWRDGLVYDPLYAAKRLKEEDIAA